MNSETEMKNIVVEWIDHNGTPQFRILSNIAAQSYMNYLTSQGLKVSVYAA